MYLSSKCGDPLKRTCYEQVLYLIAENVFLKWLPKLYTYIEYKKRELHHRTLREKLELYKGSFTLLNIRDTFFLFLQKSCLYNTSRRSEFTKLSRKRKLNEQLRLIANLRTSDQVKSAFSHCENCGMNVV